MSTVPEKRKRSSKGDSKGSFAKKLILGIILLLAVTAAAFFIYTSQYYRASDEAVSLTKTDEKIVYSDELKSYLFEPDDTSDTQRGIIFYPGAKVEETAYAPLMKQLAREGYFGVLVHMPFHLAVLGSDAAEEIIEAYPDIEQWYLMGHSLGGAMAASYAGQHADELEGLVLLAAYSTGDLSDTGLKVCSIYGEEDQVLSTETYQEYQPNLGENALEIVIRGGNHAQFGDYGAQKGDGAATISREDQQLQVVSAMQSLNEVQENEVQKNEAAVIGGADGLTKIEIREERQEE